MSTMKRKSANDGESSSPSRKKPKTTEFTGSDFKDRLKTNPSLGLQEFIDSAKKYPEFSDFDIVDDYCNVSGDCEDFLQLLNAEKSKSNEVFMMIECLQIILSRVANDLKKYRPSVRGIVRLLLTSAMGSKLNRFLDVKSNKSGHIKTVLRLLAAVVMQGSWVAREVMTWVEINYKTLVTLLNRKDMNSEEDVRTCLIEFIVSLFICDDNSVIKRIVELPGFLNEIISGLHGDRASIINLFLSALHKKVICNPTVSKTAKIHVFHRHALVGLAHLYCWTGQKHWKEMKGKDIRKRNKKVESSSMKEFNLLNLSCEQVEVREAVHGLLVELCCSVKNGINFYDKSFATSGQNMNHIMTNFLSSIQRPNEDPLTFELVCSILRTCPDQLHYYLTFLENACVPRPTAGWLQSATFVRKLYEKQPLVSPAVKFFSLVPVEELAAMTTSTVLPPMNIWACFTDAIKTPWLPVVHESLCMVAVTVKRLSATIKHVQKLTVNVANSCSDISRYVTLLTQTFIKELPSIETLIKCWNAAISSSSVSGKDKVTCSDATVEKNNGKSCSSEECLPDIPLSNQLGIILQLLSGYYFLFPNTCNQQMLDFSSLLDDLNKVDDLQSADNLEKDEFKLCYLHVLQLLAMSNVRVEELIKQKLPDRPSIFISLFNIALSVDNNHSNRLQSIIYHLLTKLLSNCELFRSNSEEVEIWLNHLMSVNPEKQPGCLNLFVSTIDEILKKPSTTLQKCTHADKQLHTFSGLVPVILKHSEEHAAFIDGVMTDLFYLQSNPVVFSQMAKQSVVKLPRLRHLTCKFLQKKKSQMEVSSMDTMDVSKAGFSEILEKYFLIGQYLSSSDVDLRTLALQLVDSLTLKQHLIAVRQTAAYLNVVAQQFNQGVKGVKEDLRFYLNLLTHIIQHCWKLTDHQIIEDKVESSDDFLLLDATEKSARDICFELSHWIFHSPVVDEYFLSSDDCRKSSRVITKQLSTLGEEVFSWFQNSSSSIFEIVISRVEEKMKDDNLPMSWGEEVFVAVHTLLNGVELPVVRYFVENVLVKRKIELAHEDGELNQLGQILVKACRRLIHFDQALESSSKLITCIFRLAEINAFSELIIDLLKAVPSCSTFVEQEVVGILLKTENQSVLRIAAVLAEISETCRNWIIQWFTSCKKWKKSTEAYKMVIFEALKHSNEEEEFGGLVFKYYWCHLLEIVFQGGLGDIKCKGAEIDFLHLLATNYATSGDINSLWNCLILTVSNPSQLTPSHTEIIFTLVDGLMAKQTSNYQELICQFFGSSVKSLTSVMNSKTDTSGIYQFFVGVLYKILLAHKLDTSVLCTNLHLLWDEFVKTGLRHHSTDHNFVKLLNEFVCQLYPLQDNQEQKAVNGIMVVNIFEMVISQSHFMPTLMSETENEIKDAVVSLLLSLVRLSSKCCKTSHFTFILGAYHATLSLTDQKLLLLLHLYENAGCDMKEAKPYFWGQKAVEHKASQKTLGMSVLPTETTEQVINLLDKSRLYESILSFPLRRSLELGDEVTDSVELKSNPESYDPAFLLPLFSHLLESGVDCLKFIELNCLGYVIAGLSCYEHGMRAMAYHDLSIFCSQLKTAKFQGKLQVSYLLECLQNSLERPNIKLAGIITVFFAKAAPLMLTPKNHMYSLVNEFLLLKPEIDIGHVPDFYKLFFSPTLEHKTERLWILNLLLDGLRDTHDYHNMEKRFTFKIIMGYYTSPISDHLSQMLVLRILTKACGIKTVASDLIKNHSLLSWITYIGDDLIQSKRPVHVTTSTVNAVVSLLSMLWKTMEDTSDGSSLTAMLMGEIMMTMKKIDRHFQNFLGEAAKDTYDRTMSSVANHVRKTSEIYPEWKQTLNLLL